MATRRGHSAVDRLSRYAGQAVAYLRRRREDRRPFARVYISGGHGATYWPDSESGRELLIAAAKLIEVERGAERG